VKHRIRNRLGRHKGQARRPYHVQPIVTEALLGRYFATAAEAKAWARRLAARHKLPVAVWQDLAGDGPATRLVETVEPDRAA
jgi:hypothetical protein